MDISEVQSLKESGNRPLEEESKDPQSLVSQPQKSVDMSLQGIRDDLKVQLSKDKDKYNYLHYLMHAVFNDLVRLDKEIHILKLRKDPNNIGKNVDWMSITGFSELYKEKKKKKFILHEVCFHFYNGLRSSLLTKTRHDLAYIGPVLLKNPSAVKN